MLRQRREKPFSLKQTQLLSTLTMERAGHPKLSPKNQAPFFKRCSYMRGRRRGFVAEVAHLYAAEEEERLHPMLTNIFFRRVLDFKIFQLGAGVSKFEKWP